MALKIGTTEPTEIKVIKNSATTNLTVYKYATTGEDLGEAKRSTVSTYTKANLDSWVGLQNDTWGAITNASSLVADRYYYIRVLVSDTNKYGKFCVRFKSYSGQTITTENMGWGYDGEVIYSTPVWGKPFPLTIQAGANSTVTVNRTSSPNQHANTGAVTSGGMVYYGDTLTITATPASEYKLVSFTINGTEYASGQTSAVSQTITVTSAVSIIVNTESAASWKTVWEGTRNITPARVSTGPLQTVEGYPFSATLSFTGVQPDIETRITFEPPDVTVMSKVITNEETIICSSSSGGVSWTLSAYVDGEKIKFPLRGFSQLSGKVLITVVKLTKVEQYY